MPKPKIPAGRGRNLLAAVLASAVAGAASAAQPVPQHWRCTNATSGANWTIVVDAADQRVDRFPATITERWASWRDPGRGFFDLDRATGALQLRNASSTGGYFLRYRCRRD
ncbi:MAG TPA: hypothetical protein VMF86_11960 [Stellaceae bacterium]|nr:hypothetical protein [Stellaceae bacterium]